jgi:adenylate kinase
VSRTTSPRPRAMLLLGPTGSGKTPLGQMLETHGWHGQPCWHFDFGQHLRQAVAVGPDGGLVTPEEHEYLTQVLATGALLEEGDFPIAQRILQSFLDRVTTAGSAPLAVLNGLPRHAGQAVAIASMVSIDCVTRLDCPTAVVQARIAANRGGDRHGRVDDQPADIARKLRIYEQRTAPLVDFLRDRGSRIIPLEVTREMTPWQAWQRLQNA